MDKKPNKKTLNILKKHLKFLKKTFNPEKIILFGSRARGDNLEESDFDLIIVSEKFKDIDFRERMIKAYGNWDKKEGLDVICYTPEEFKKLSKRITIVKEAVEKGIEIL